MKGTFESAHVMNDTISFAMKKFQKMCFHANLHLFAWTGSFTNSVTIATQSIEFIKKNRVNRLLGNQIEEYA